MTLKLAIEKTEAVLLSERKIKTTIKTKNRLNTLVCGLTEI